MVETLHIFKTICKFSQNFRGIAAGISGELSGEDIARICIDCKADIIMVQNEQILKKVIYRPQLVYAVIRHILV